MVVIEKLSGSVDYAGSGFSEILVLLRSLFCEDIVDYAGSGFAIATQLLSGVDSKENKLLGWECFVFFEMGSFSLLVSCDSSEILVLPRSLFL